MEGSEVLLKGAIFAFYSNTQQWQLVVVSLGVPLLVYILLLYLWPIAQGHYHATSQHSLLRCTAGTAARYA